MVIQSSALRQPSVREALGFQTRKPYPGATAAPNPGPTGGGLSVNDSFPLEQRDHTLQYASGTADVDLLFVKVCLVVWKSVAHGFPSHTGSCFVCFVMCVSHCQYLSLSFFELQAACEVAMFPWVRVERCGTFLTCDGHCFRVSNCVLLARREEQQYVVDLNRETAV